ncbi:MAG: hypothetical protein ACP5QI_06110 [Candidatus Bathyarchaeia archaeon]
MAINVVRCSKMIFRMAKTKFQLPSLDKILEIKLIHFAWIQELGAALNKPNKLRLILFRRRGGLEMKTLEWLNLDEIAENLDDGDTLGIYISKEEDFKADR